MLLCLLLCVNNNECCVSGPITRILMSVTQHCLLLCMNNNECCVSGPITRILMSVTLLTTLHE